MATLIRTDGTSEVLDVPAAGLTLAQLYELVGGHIEIVKLTGTIARGRWHVLVVDESGLLRDKPINAAATWMYRGARQPGFDGVIVGDAVHAVICDPGTDRERIL